ncbi:hypothetical protein Trydic_g6318 [Trypoxylus dichotomus]
MRSRARNAVSKGSPWHGTSAAEIVVHLIFGVGTEQKKHRERRAKAEREEENDEKEENQRNRTEPVELRAEIEEEGVSCRVRAG